MSALGGEGGEDKGTETKGGEDKGGEDKGGTTPAEKNWLEKLGVQKEYTEHSALEHIKDVGSLVKSYIHSQGMIGKDKVAIPTEKSSAE